MFSLVKNSLKSLVLITCFNHLATSWNVLALSEYTVLGLPLRAINRLKKLMNSFVVKFGVNSKCTALLRLHEKRSMSALDSFFILCGNIQDLHSMCLLLGRTSLLLTCLLVMVLVLVMDKVLHDVACSCNNCGDRFCELP